MFPRSVSLSYLGGRKLLQDSAERRAGGGGGHVSGPLSGHANRHARLQRGAQLVAQRAQEALGGGGLLRRRQRGLLAVEHGQHQARDRGERGLHQLRRVVEELGARDAERVAPVGSRCALVLQHPRRSIRAASLVARRRRRRRRRPGRRLVALRPGLGRRRTQQRLLVGQLRFDRVQHQRDLLVELLCPEQRVRERAPRVVGERPRAEVARDEGEAQHVEDAVGEGDHLRLGLARGGGGGRRVLGHRLLEALVPGAVEQLAAEEEQPAPGGVGDGGGAGDVLRHAQRCAQREAAGVRQDARRLRLHRLGGCGGDAAGGEGGAEEAHGLSLRKNSDRGPRERGGLVRVRKAAAASTSLVTGVLGKVRKAGPRMVSWSERLRRDLRRKHRACPAAPVSVISASGSPLAFGRSTDCHAESAVRATT